MQKLVIASNNPGKLREIRALLPMEVVLQSELAIPEADVPLVERMMVGKLVLDALPDRTIGFTVDLISPIVEPSSARSTDSLSRK